jgi:hypothetical protein
MKSEKTTKAQKKYTSFFIFIPHKRDLHTRPESIDESIEQT